MVEVFLPSWRHKTTLFCCCSIVLKGRFTHCSKLLNHFKAAGWILTELNTNYKFVKSLAEPLPVIKVKMVDDGSSVISCRPIIIGADKKVEPLKRRL